MRPVKPRIGDRRMNIAPTLYSPARLIAWDGLRFPAKTASGLPVSGKWERKTGMGMRLDRLDRQLLACLQADNLQTADRLAEQVGRSPSAIARRLRRLRATGAVAADVALLSEEAAGNPLSAIVHPQL